MKTLLNNNMRCFEMKLEEENGKNAEELNNNMRCFEIKFSRTFYKKMKVKQ